MVNQDVSPAAGTNPTAQQRSASAVRKLILTASGLVCLVGASYFIGTASGQPAGEAADAPHKIGLLDIGYIFERYEKLKMREEDSKNEITDAQKKAESYVNRIREKQQEIKGFKEDSEDFIKREKEINKLMAEFDTFKKSTERDMVRKRAKMYHEAYMEVQDVVDRACEKYGYTLILRFTREDLNSTDPQKVMQGLQRSVIWSRPNDDLTEPVLNALNKKYGGGSPSTTGPQKKTSGPKVDKNVEQAESVQPRAPARGRGGSK
jgi:outer membrane protein